MLRIAVCDDDAVFLQAAEQMIRRWSEQSGVPTEIHRFDNGDELLAKCMVQRMDVIVLDIVMPLLNGMDAAKELRARDNAVRIIFLTSSPEFALESYEVRTFWYLLKPLDEVRFHAVLDSWYEVHQASMAHFPAITD